MLGLATPLFVSSSMCELVSRVVKSGSVTERGGA